MSLTRYRFVAEITVAVDAAGTLQHKLPTGARNCCPAPRNKDGALDVWSSYCARNGRVVVHRGAEDAAYPGSCKTVYIAPTPVRSAVSPSARSDSSAFASLRWTHAGPRSNARALRWLRCTAWTDRGGKCVDPPRTGPYSSPDFLVRDIQVGGCSVLVCPRNPKAIHQWSDGDSCGQQRRHESSATVER